MNSNEAVSLGQLLYDGKYHVVIDRGERYLKKHKDDAGVHVMLMDAYFKLRKEDWSNVSRSTEHAKRAILLGHDTGYCHERMLKNLREMEQYHRAAQLCDMVLRPDFEFSTHGCGKKDYFAKAKEAVLKQIERGNAKDGEHDVAFGTEQIAAIINQTKAHKELEKKAKKVWEQAQKAWDEDNDKAYDRLIKQYHEIQQQI